MTRAALGAVVMVAVAAGLGLRVARLDVRPMHHDEANQAVKFGALLERGEYRYDPHDHHGPTLYYLSLPAAWLRGQATLAALDERTLRGVTALFGAATILLMPLLSSGVGRTAAAASALLLAVSPALVFYSRMFIQEALFACFALATVIAIGRATTSGGFGWSMLAGAGAGLAVATKETAAVIVPAAVAACVFSWRSLGTTRRVLSGPNRACVATGVLVAGAVATLFYTSFLAFPGALPELFVAFPAYLDRGIDTASHAQPWYYYLGLLAYSSSGGVIWSEGAVLGLAALGLGAACGLLRSAPVDQSPAGSGVRLFWARYLACYAVLTTAIFSAIPYKTPWNLLPFYVAVVVLAGMGVSWMVHAPRPRPLRVALMALFITAVAHLGWQAWRASVTYAADPRNPYVYAQTVPDTVRMITRIRGLAAVHEDGDRMQVSVVAGPYEQWPLPWYLRAMPNVGYWPAPGNPAAMHAPAVVVSMDHTAAVEAALGDRYVSEFYGLRPGVLLVLYIERSLWERFLDSVSRHERSREEAGSLTTEAQGTQGRAEISRRTPTCPGRG